MLRPKQSQANLNHNFHKNVWLLRCELIRIPPLGITFYTFKKAFNIFLLMKFFLKGVGLWLDLDWIVNPFWKVDLDCQSHICDGFGLDWQSEKNWIEQQPEYRLNFFWQKDIGANAIIKCWWNWPQWSEEVDEKSGRIWR